MMTLCLAKLKPEMSPSTIWVRMGSVSVSSCCVTNTLKLSDLKQQRVLFLRASWADWAGWLVWPSSAGAVWSTWPRPHIWQCLVSAGVAATRVSVTMWQVNKMWFIHILLW